MPTLRDCVPQSVLALLQSAAVIAGSLAVALSLRIFGKLEDGNEHRLWPLPFFIRHFGFLYLVLPVAWTCATLWAERAWSSWFTTRYTIITGLMVLAGIIWFFCINVARAGGTLISEVN